MQKQEPCDDDEIISIKAETFNQAVEQAGGSSKAKRAREDCGSSQTSPRKKTRVNHTGRSKIDPLESSIGLLIQEKRKMQKRTTAESQWQLLTSSSKRRKVSFEDSLPLATTSPSSIKTETVSYDLRTPHSKPKALKETTDSIKKEPLPSSIPMSTNSKRRATSPLPETTSPRAYKPKSGSVPNRNATCSQPNLKPEIIEISSDDEQVPKVLAPRRKKRRRLNSPVTIVIDSDDPPLPEAILSDDDDWDPPGFDINDSEMWKTMSVNQNKLEIDPVDRLEIENLSLTNRMVPKPSESRYIHPDTSRPYPQLLSQRNSESSEPRFVWEQLRRVKNLNYRPRPKPLGIHSPGRIYMRPWKLDLNLNRLKLQNSFKEAPGSIVKIDQKGPWTVICSACAGGLPDEGEVEIDSYNRPGSLMTWNKEIHVPKGHQSNMRSCGRAKHYAVHDVKFNPSGSIFASTGSDKKLRIWTLLDPHAENEGSDDNFLGGHETPQPQWINSVTEAYQRVPHDLAFKADTHPSILAVAERKVYINAISEYSFETKTSFQLHPVKAPHIVGSIAWGIESTSNLFFASSEPIFVDPEFLQGQHVGYDVNSEAILFRMDAEEAGDTLCINSTGSTLALTTRAAEDRNFLRLYDIGRREPKARTAINLNSFPVRYEGFDGEVNCTSFSPDGIYLAVARNDNHTHVYDSRFLERGPMFDYHHHGMSKAASFDSLFGVVKAQWLHSAHTRRMALVTAGEDGCVRLWDPARSDQDDNVIAEVNSDIAYFSIGDPFAGENQIVVGDCAGEVSIFNTLI